MMNRRDFYRLGTLALGGLMGLILAVPGVAYLLDPAPPQEGRQQGDFQTLTRLSQLAWASRRRSRSSTSARTPG